MLIKLAVQVTNKLLKYGSIISTPPLAGDLIKTFQPSKFGSKSTHGIYVTPPLTDWKSLKDVVKAQRKGATTNTVQTTIKKYFKKIYSLFIIYSFNKTLVNTFAIIVRLMIMMIK